MAVVMIGSSLPSSSTGRVECHEATITNAILACAIRTQGISDKIGARIDWSG